MGIILWSCFKVYIYYISSLSFIIYSFFLLLVIIIVIKTLIAFRDIVSSLFEKEATRPSQKLYPPSIHSLHSSALRTSSLRLFSPALHPSLWPPSWMLGPSCPGKLQDSRKRSSWPDLVPSRSQPHFLPAMEWRLDSRSGAWLYPARPGEEFWCPGKGKDLYLVNL